MKYKTINKWIKENKIMNEIERKKKKFLTNRSLIEMDKKYGSEIIERDGKIYYSGASTDWCTFPIEMVPWANSVKKGE